MEHTKDTTSLAAKASMSAQETLLLHCGSPSTASLAFFIVSTASGDNVKSAPL